MHGRRGQLDACPWTGGPGGGAEGVGASASRHLQGTCGAQRGRAAAGRRGSGGECPAGPLRAGQLARAAEFGC
ncbi:hypothetical protein [Lentzea atacamensis]|uniref:hypothetical protein n=1 Tax=Lentzea atacamensis TaxID=531938 RepID=UPI0011BF2B71|nr:hypothetical protein [Lentzea atacamensis]